jgi:hypothetical protein
MLWNFEKLRNFTTLDVFCTAKTTFRARDVVEFHKISKFYNIANITGKLVRALGKNCRTSSTFGLAKLSPRSMVSRAQPSAEFNRRPG